GGNAQAHGDRTTRGGFFGDAGDGAGRGFPSLRAGGSLRHEPREDAQATGLVDDDAFGGAVEAVAPPVVERVGVGLVAVGREGEGAELVLIEVEPAEARLHAAERDAGRRHDTAIVEGVLMDDLALAAPTHAGEVRSTDRVGAGLV